MTEMAKYTVSITCDVCDQHVCYWRYAGPFHGSVVCDSCYNNPENWTEDAKQ